MTETGAVNCDVIFYRMNQHVQGDKNTYQVNSEVIEII